MFSLSSFRIIKVAELTEQMNAGGFLGVDLARRIFEESNARENPPECSSIALDPDHPGTKRPMRWVPIVMFRSAFEPTWTPTASGTLVRME